MPDIVLTGLRLIFIAFLYLFVWQVASAVRSHVGFGTERSASGRPKEIVVVRSDTQPGASIEIDRVVVVGRSPQADFVLDDPYASEFHFRLVAEDGHLVLHDLGSTNSTYVNGRRVTAPVRLARGDTIQVGKTVMEVR